MKNFIWEKSWPTTERRRSGLWELKRLTWRDGWLTEEWELIEQNKCGTKRSLDESKSSSSKSARGPSLPADDQTGASLQKEQQEQNEFEQQVLHELQEQKEQQEQQEHQEQKEKNEQQEFLDQSESELQEKKEQKEDTP